MTEKIDKMHFWIRKKKVKNPTNQETKNCNIQHIKQPQPIKNSFE